MKTSKVTQTFDTGETWSNDHGMFHKWAIKFENGDAGICNVKNGFQCKFITGNESSYEYTETGEKFPNKVKFVNPEHQTQNYQQPVNQPYVPPQDRTNPLPNQSTPTPPFDATRNSIERQCCIKAAADLHKETGATAENVIQSAKLFHAWITSE